MRKIDIQNSRDYYKECLNSALRCMTEMAAAFERQEELLQSRIKELETKLEGVKCAKS